MIFAGIDVDIVTHEKALAAGVEAFGLWAWCMCWTQKHATDGRIPRVAILSALGEKPRNIRRALVRLCSSGLLIEITSGDYFELHNYGRKNQTAEEIREKKARAADRVRAWRERRNTPVQDPVTRNEDIRTDPQPEPSPEPDNTTRKQKSESESARESSVRHVAEPTLDDALPETWHADAKAQVEPTGETVDIPAEWKLYLADRMRPEQAKRISAADWRGWVLKAIGFAKKHRMAESDRKVVNAERDAKRDATFAKAREPAEARPRDSRKTFRERDAWADTAGPPDPETAERMRKLMGGVGR